MTGNKFSICFLSIVMIMNGFFVTGPLKGQSFKPGHTILRFRDGDRGNRMIRVSVYYPAFSGGKNKAPAPPEPPYPVVVFGHGYQLPASIYENITKALISEGFIVAFPLTEKGMFPSHRTLGRDIAFVAAQMRKEGASPESPLFGIAGEKCCFMGHSMGGGSAVLGAAYSFQPDAIALLSPLETRPSAVAVASSLSFPALIFAGGNDCITPPESNQDPLFAALNSTDKTYITIHGGSHCQMARYHYLCRLAEGTCRPKPAISREEQHAIINRYLVPWLKSRLKGKTDEGEQMDKTLKQDPSVTFSMKREK